ncbi:hypothetical protein LTSEALA_0086, partial [Salmonella enterica subsp. enterica serovar Alachua str. R6-377]
DDKAPVGDKSALTVHCCSPLTPPAHLPAQWAKTPRQKTAADFAA